MMFSHGMIIKTDPEDNVEFRIHHHNINNNNNKLSLSNFEQQQYHRNVDENIESKNLFQKDIIKSLLKKTLQNPGEIDDNNSNGNTKINHNNNAKFTHNDNNHIKYNSDNNNNTYDIISNIRNRRSNPFGDTCKIEKYNMTNVGPCKRTVTINVCSGACRYIPILDNYTTPIPGKYNKNNKTMTKTNISTDYTCWERICVMDRITTVPVHCNQIPGGIKALESAVSCSCAYRKCASSILLQPNP